MAPDDEPAAPTRLADSFGAAAYGGEGWQARAATHRAELGRHWAACGVENEWAPLRAVLLSPPGPALGQAAAAPDAHQLLAPVDLARAVEEHAGLEALYRAEGVSVIAVPGSGTHPNQMFAADLFAMTPEGAILARPASEVRAGEEVAVAAALAAARVPILGTLTGHATFEGADLMWLDPEAVLIGRGLRTNSTAIAQIERMLGEIGVSVLSVDMPWGVMHLMGMLRILAPDLAIAWPRRTPHAAVAALMARGVEVVFPPRDLPEAASNTGFNVVTLAPRRIAMPWVEGGAGLLAMRRFYEAAGVEVLLAPMGELRKAAGAVGCLTGIVAREG
ncbi:MAG: arginine deiminase family protein [Pseudomonadota bacterium]